MTLKRREFCQVSVPLVQFSRMVVALMVVTLAGCITPLSPGALFGRLNDATAVRPYPFTALGTVTYTTPGGGGTGNVALAVDGHHYRLEVTDPMGATRLAVGGDRRRQVRLDPATGERLEIPLGPNHQIPLGDGAMTLPAGLVQTAVTGALPDTGPMTAAFPHGSLACFASMEPTLTFCVGDRLEEVWFPGGDERRIVMSLGPENDDAPIHRRWAKVTDRQQGVAVEIRWRSVHKGHQRPDGFFTFEEEAL